MLAPFQWLQTGQATDMATPDNTPILVGTGQQTWHQSDAGRTPVDALHEVGASAIADTRCARITGAIDALAMVRFIADTTPGIGALFPRNPGAALAQRLGIDKPAIFQGTIGGNTPQYLVNHFAGKLARGEHSAVLLAGAELLATLFSVLRSGEDISAWADAGTEPPTLGVEREGHTAAELAHGLYEPINTYPLFENSLCHHLGGSREHHIAEIAELCSHMSRVAADNPLAWRPEFQTAQRIRTVEKRNRYIGYPYTRAMNPVLEVDMAAAVIMTTAGKARELGIDESRWIYLHAGADVNDIWYVSERPTLHSSAAVKLAWQTVSAQAGIRLDEISHFDIYSCFPSAVRVACREIGLDPLDSRGVTVTGGLPFFGGPGNNYSLHAIAQMVDTLRNGAGGHGLVTANGMYLTKHSLGIYSTLPPARGWQDTDNAALQRQVDAAPRMTIAADPSGDATIETYTVSFGREGPQRGIVIARSDAGERIVANTRADEATLQQLMSADPIGHRGRVRVEDGLNILEL
ncbi:MAG: acetyl-CoA acetyltransferase [Halioglobus sp.]|nr:acetyl-CoA acetyltransferase [Halioglobus sp.]